MLKLYWKDPNLNFGNISQILQIPPDVEACLWKPDVTFYNCKDTSEFSFTLPNAVTKILPKGLFYTFSRYAITVVCQLDLRNYPMDRQECSLLIQLFSSRDEDVILRWLHTSDNSVPINDKSIRSHQLITIKLQQFKMEEPVPLTKHVTFTTGNTTVLDCRFKFSRYTTSAIVNVYFPSFLVVWLSYVSFFLDVNAVPGRVTLGVTAFLTVATQMVSVRTSLPTVNYITAIDVWLFGCLILVFLSLIEFILAYISTRNLSHNKINVFSEKPVIHSNNTKERIRSSVNKLEREKPVNLSSNCACVNQNYFASNENKALMVTSNPIDKLCKIVFPVFFLGFTCCYWLFYCHTTNKNS